MTFPVQNFKVRLANARMLSPYVRELTFEKEDGGPFEFEAGQWVNVHIAGEPGKPDDVTRAYSIASEPNGRNTFQLAVTKVEGGPGSTHLHAMREGDVLSCTGPQGLFVRRHDVPTLFVGTGTGVTPLRSMLKHALAQKKVEPLWLLFGVRREEDMLYQDELSALAHEHPNVHVYYTLSQGSEAWMGRRGYVQTHVRGLWEEMAKVGEAHGATDKPHVYICGLQKMVTSVREVLRKEMELPRQLVHSERYD
ncbi:MAG: FAD-dependent oxidoreductase [Polyangiaceae bacterium]